MEMREKMPAVALRGMTILPDMMIHFDLSREKSIQAVEQAMCDDQRVFLVAQKRSETETPQQDDVYRVGCIARIKQVTKLPDNLVRVMVEGISRGILYGFVPEETAWLLADVEEVPDIGKIENFNEEEAMSRNIRELFAEYCRIYPRTGRTLLRHMDEIYSLGHLLDQIVESMPVDYTLKQKVLDALDVSDRYEVLAEILSNEIEVAKIRADLAEKVKERVEKNQKDYILREQLHYIQ